MDIRNTLCQPFALIDKIISYMGLSNVADLVGGTLFCKIYGGTCNFIFGAAAFFCNLFDSMPVVIPCMEVHACVHPSDVLAECLLDDTHRFNKFSPVNFSQK